MLARDVFHINLCEKEDCSACKFLDIYISFLVWGSSSSEDEISFFHHYYGKNYNEFYFLFSLFFSLTKSELEKVNLDGTLKRLLIDQYGEHI